MPISISFAKASGAGNDFVVVNNMNGRYSLDQASLARSLCSRHTGIGADGLLVLEPSGKADFRMIYYNADGSHGGMCGNGGRCIALFAMLSGIVGMQCRFEALDYVYEAKINIETVELKMKNPSDFRRGLQVKLGESQYECHRVNTGAPHVIIFVDELESVDVQDLGQRLRNHAFFQPEGTNVNFVKKLGRNTIAIRTYERGVEAETLACGTGSIASAVVASLVHNMEFPIVVQARSGENLRIYANKAGEIITNIVLHGPAKILFTGNVLYDTASGAIVSSTKVNE